jgi:large exoprotein involved in heme utilization and adhesion
LDVRASNGGDVVINVQNLDISSSQLAAGVNQSGALKPEAGAIQIDATGTVNITQGSNLLSDVSTQTQGRQIRGKGGQIAITANNLSVQSGSEINTNTFGIGDAGGIKIQVADRISLGDATGIRSQVLGHGIGNGGTIQILTRSLTLESGADIATSVLNNGTGNAGDLDIQATDSVTISGFTPTRLSSGGSFFASGLRVNHDSTGSGNGGNITVQSGKIILSDGGLIEATTTTGDGGNITLTAENYLLMRRSSSISTSAGKIGAGGNGGNITITTPFVIAILSENSDIRANAFTGAGGNITITAQGIYGLQFQTDNTPFSDITASSRFGVSGTITLNTPNIDPSRGLVALVLGLTERTDQMGLGCAAQGKLAKKENRFTFTGRGGMPSYPEEMFMGSDRTLIDPIDPVETIQTKIIPTDLHSAPREFNSSPIPTRPSASPTPTPDTQIIEAQGWITDANGIVHLVAEVPAPELIQPGFLSNPCQSSQTTK